ncbi:unnamed protein product, partial [Didymodactylos carnosus]
MASVTDNYEFPQNPQLLYDEEIHKPDTRARDLLENYTDILNRDSVPIEAETDGDCLYHSCRTFYPNVSIDEIRFRCIQELCLHDQYYTTTISNLGLDLVDDESVEDHVLRIINNGEYTSVLTLAALSSVFDRPIRSVYPNVNRDISGEEDGYYTLLNRTFESRQKPQNPSSALQVMWSGPKPERDRIWRTNHFQHQWSSSHEKTRSSITLNENEQELLQLPATTMDVLEQEENDENKPDSAAFLSRQTFLDAANVIQQVISVSPQVIDSQPPKVITKASTFIIKNSEENKQSVGKDGCGVWLQDRSETTSFVLCNNKSYQIVRRGKKGKFIIMKELVGIIYPILLKKIVLLHLKGINVYSPLRGLYLFIQFSSRIYATNKSDPPLRRMICYTTKHEENNVESIPIFVQYVWPRKNPSVQKLSLKPHGNASKIARPFTSTVPTVLSSLR